VLGYSLVWAAAAAALLSATYTYLVPFTSCCLTLGIALGAGSGAIFKIVGLGGFFPPIVMGIVKTLTGSYSLGFALLGVVAAACLALLLPGRSERRPR
jgi:NNP family nitrate/nitrite transporter-like MFS transporter